MKHTSEYRENSLTKALDRVSSGGVLVENREEEEARVRRSRLRLCKSKRRASNAATSVKETRQPRSLAASLRLNRKPNVLLVCNL